jgi:uncharacterized membrane protein YdfJ with MMPL/SSD domain
MDVRILYLLCFFVFFSVAQAEIYKCTVNGKMIFSDQACATNAEIIDIKVYKPSYEAVQQQQQSTKRFSESSRVSDILALKKKNEALENRKLQLQKSAEQQLKELEKKTYSVPNGTASTERGVFQKMADVENNYRRDVNKINAEIQNNERKISELTSRAPQ